MERLLVTIPDAAEALGVSRTVVYQLLSRGELDAVRINRSRRIPADSVRAFVDRRLEGSRAARGK